MMLLGLSRLLWKQLNFDSFCKRHLFYCSDDVFTSTVFENSNIAAWNKIALAYLALKNPQIKLDTPGTQGPVCGSCWTHHWTHHNSAYYIKKTVLVWRQSTHRNSVLPMLVCLSQSVQQQMAHWQSEDVFMCRSQLVNPSDFLCSITQVEYWPHLLSLEIVIVNWLSFKSILLLFKTFNQCINLKAKI